MNPVAIRLQGIGKQYRLGARRERYKTLGETLTDAVAQPFRRIGDLLRRGGSGPRLNGTIWALKDVSLEIARGEVLGLIGRNGAGKSTLLKILSRITEPTTGFAEIRGRVGSLLEVGTGFHLELTGRENIYLNGAILGMKRMEIGRKFDEIVSFAEVERFIDTPVKHYSSGMVMRLAFAVAAHLEPQILLVDEVLAVGDARFQKKCLNKMEEVGHEGRTVLFVSHNVAAITRLCSRVVLLEEGKVLLDGPAREVVGAYLSMSLGTSAVREWAEPAKAPGREVVRLRAVRVRTDDGALAENADIRRPVSVEMEYDVLRSGHVVSVYYDFYTDEGVMAFSAADLDPTWRRQRRPAGRYVSTVCIPGNLLSEGTVFVTAGGRTMDPITPQFQERDVVAFHVVDGAEGDSARGDWVGEWQGVIRPLLQWNTRFTPEESRSDSEMTEGLGRNSK